jgi:hypothetical protein
MHALTWFFGDVACPGATTFAVSALGGAEGQGEAEPPPHPDHLPPQARTEREFFAAPFPQWLG